MATLHAHETWFEEGHRELDWSFLLEPATLVLLAGAVMLTLLVRLAARAWNGIDVGWIAPMAPFMPFAIRMHLAVSLVGMLGFGAYLSPDMELRPDATGIVLGATSALVAVGMAAGWHARAAAVLLVLAGPLGMLEFGVAPVLQRIDLLGLALCILVLGPGRWSADRELGRVAPPTRAQEADGVLVLRVLTGVALVVVAVQEKLANPELALALLQDYPVLNVAQLSGLPIGDLGFIRLAGSIEVLLGLLLVSGALPQLAVVAIGVPFNATLYFFGAVELVGHLPLYGTMLLLLVYGSHPELRPLVGSFRLRRRGLERALHELSGRPAAAPSARCCGRVLAVAAGRRART